MAISTYRNSLLIVVFICLISFPFINNQFLLIKDLPSTENRKMADKPVVNINHLDAYPGNFNKYFNDNFSLRFQMIHAYNSFTLALFKKSPMPDYLIIGKDNWLFLTGNELDAYRSKTRLTEKELNDYTTEFEYRKKYLEKVGCKFYVLVAPIKAAIYRDKMPDHVFPIHNKSWGEQLVDHLEQHSDVNVINLYPIFQKLHQTEPIYFKLDNHWNAIGAYYGASEFFNKVHKDFPAIHSIPLSEYDLTKKEHNDGDIVRMLSNTSIYTDTMYYLTPKKGFAATKDSAFGYPTIKEYPYFPEYEYRYSIKNAADTSKPKLLIISDSFGGGFFPYAQEQFGETVKIFDFWQYKLNESIVKNEKPDVVLLIMLEANMKNLLRHTSSPDVERAKF